MAFFRRSLLPALGGAILLALWFGGLSWLTDAGIRKFERHTVLDPVRPDAPQAWRSGRFFVEPDSYYWLAYARDLRAAGAWRLRFTHADNAPYGREMHWAHLPIWGLMSIARLLETAGAPPALALELAGRALMPLFGWLCFSALFILLGTRLGWRIAALATAPLVATSNWTFQTLRPDHHGFQLAFAVGTWICLAFGGMGWVRKDAPSARGPFDPPNPEQARRWFIASGILGGCGLWLGATVFLFSLAALAAGAAVAMIFMRPPAGAESIEIRPELWRLWSISSALVSLLFYAVEYAPLHMGMRLEVNHPLYALCWLGTAECLRVLAQWKKTNGKIDSKSRFLAAGGLLSGGLLPCLILFGPAEWYWPRSLIMLRLHTHHINEFWTLFTVAGAHWPTVFLNAFKLLLLAGFGAIALHYRRRLSFAQQSILLPLGCLSVVFLLLYLWQIRWAPFALAAEFLLAAFVLAALGERLRTPPPDPLLRPLLVLLPLLFVYQFGDAVWDIAGPLRRLFQVEKIETSWLTPLLQRNLMLQLKTQSSGTPLRLMLPAEMAPAAYYFGVGDSIGSLYWENPAGLTATAEFFGDPLPGLRAREIARERGITHVLMNSGAGDAVMFYHLATGECDHPGASRTIGGATAQAGTPVPAWLRSEPEPNATANLTYYTRVPRLGQWIPLNLPLRIYRPEL